MNPLRIMHITDNLGMGGLERVITDLSLHLRKDLFSPAVCCLHFKGEFSNQLETSGIPVFLLPQVKGVDYTAFLKIISEIRKFRPHIIHTHNTNALIDGIIAALATGTPVRVHTDHGRQFPDRFRYMVIEWLLAHGISKIVAVSDQTRDSLIHYEHINQSKIITIHNGVPACRPIDDDILRNKRTEIGIDRFRHTVGVVGRLEREKGPQHLVQAIPAVLAEHPSTVFVFAGQGGMLQTLQSECARLNISEAVKFIGPRRDVHEILRLLDVYVLPSEREGLPLSLLEAMSAQCPIVASNVGGVPFALEHHKSGILTDPGSPQELSSGICTLLSDPQRRKNYGEAAYEKYHTLFTIEAMTRSYENLYLELARKKGLVL